MKLLITILVTFFAGMGAGLGTGFAGMSAAAVISPMLITFLDMNPYMAVGIALASDVLASAVSAYTYYKNKNLDIRNGLIMMVSVLIFTVTGSYIASLVPATTMGGFSVFMTFLLGIKFIVRPVMTTKESMLGVSAGKRAIQSILCGMIIGFICGFIGAGVMIDDNGKILGENNVAVNAQDYHKGIVNNNIAEEFVYNASFIKLRELSLGYTFPQSVLNKMKVVKGLSVSLVGRNLWTILKHTDNIDPESAYNNTNGQGLELNGYPATRNVGFNVNVKF